MDPGAECSAAAAERCQERRGLIVACGQLGQSTRGDIMKLFRHGAAGLERAGALDSRGVRRDLSLLVPDITPEWLAPDRLRAIATIDLERMPLVPDGVRLGAPVSGTRQFVAIGLNYRKHAAESGLPITKDPLVFNKAITCIQGPDDDVI